MDTRENFKNSWLAKKTQFALMELFMGTADKFPLNWDSTRCLCGRTKNKTALHIYLATPHPSRVGPGSHQTFIIDGIKKSLLSFLSLCKFFQPEFVFIFVLFHCDDFFKRSVPPTWFESHLKIDWHFHNSGISTPYRYCLPARVSDPHWFNADPDTDPDPAFFLIADPDSGSGSRIRIQDLMI